MNRLHNNIWVIDSGGLWLTADSSDSGAFLNSSISGFSFTGVGSGHLEIVVQSDTVGNVVVKIMKDQSTNDTLHGPDFSSSMKIQERMFVRTCLGGTGFLYLS